LGDLVDIACYPGSPESCLYDGQPAVYIFDFEYGSTNPNLPGDGYGIAAVIDAGEGNHVYDDGDMLYVEFTDGPFAGYTNDGPVSGNIQAHEDGCPIGVP